MPVGALRLKSPQGRDAAAKQARSRSERNALTDAEATLMTPMAEGPGTVIGRYTLLQMIGEGGFGVVYMAEQEEPVRRKVALKIIKQGMDTKQVIARFEAERQALALMGHPNIAKGFDAGATATGAAPPLPLPLTPLAFLASALAPAL